MWETREKSKIVVKWFTELYFIKEGRVDLIKKVKPVIFIASLVTFFTVILALSACDSDDDPQPLAPTPWSFPEIIHFPTNLNIPDNNPMTVEGIELGRYLFYDGRLSGRSHPDSLMSCGTCHIQANAFECGPDHPKYKGHPFGIPTKNYPEGKPTPHVMMPLANLAYINSGYLWNGLIHESTTKKGPDGYDFMGDNYLNFKSLESLVWMGIVAEHEMNGSIEKTVDMIASIDMYGAMFKAAFGDEVVNIDRISKAIAQFVRSIISYRFKYYKFTRHEVELTPAEKRGYNLFFSEDADCFHCHAGSLLMTTTEYYNNAKDTVFNDSRDRYAVTGSLWHKGSYRAPSLINIELTGPYMHDGRFETLDEVIDFYSEELVYSEYVDPLMKYVRYGGVHMTVEQKADLKSFLLTFTDHDLLTDPAYSCPEDLGEFSVKNP
ncbi:cytochrome-c peroxidase [Bacteroidota bacterium]